MRVVVGETYDQRDDSEHSYKVSYMCVEAKSLPSPITSGENILIPVQGFLLFARVVVVETYDRRS